MHNFSKQKLNFSDSDFDMFSAVYNQPMRCVVLLKGGNIYAFDELCRKVKLAREECEPLYFQHLGGEGSRPGAQRCYQQQQD